MKINKNLNKMVAHISIHSFLLLLLLFIVKLLLHCCVAINGMPQIVAPKCSFQVDEVQRNS